MKVKHCRLSRDTQIRLMGFFVREVTARSAADQLAIQVNSAALYYRRIREVIARQLSDQQLNSQHSLLRMEDFCYFGLSAGRRRNRTPSRADCRETDQARYSDRNGIFLFGVAARNGKIFIRFAQDDEISCLEPVIRQEIAPDHFYFGEDSGGAGLLNSCALYCDPELVSQSAGNQNNNTFGLENFWRHTRQVLRKYNGVSQESLPLFLKECEFRFNYRTADQQLQCLKSWIEI